MVTLLRLECHVKPTSNRQAPSVSVTSNRQAPVRRAPTHSCNCQMPCGIRRHASLDSRRLLLCRPPCASFLSKRSKVHVVIFNVIFIFAVHLPGRSRLLIRHGRTSGCSARLSARLGDGSASKTGGLDSLDCSRRHPPPLVGNPRPVCSLAQRRHPPSESPRVRLTQETRRHVRRSTGHIAPDGQLVVEELEHRRDAQLVVAPDGRLFKWTT